MEDRYLFKAKHFEKWHIGNIVKEPDGLYIRDIKGNVMAYIDDESTICQCTGLKDKNGKLIWENDIVRFKHEKFDFKDELEPFERTCLPNKKEYKRNYVVEFCNTPTHYGLRFRNGSIWFMVHKMTVVMHDTEVIGNIFDNPELLESEE